MSNENDQEELNSLATNLAKNIKTDKHLSDLSRTLLKITVETALGAEMEAHPGYGPHETQCRNSGNSRKGHFTKRLKGDHGEVEIVTPRDHDNSFEPQIIRKGQTRLTQFDGQILALTAKSMSTRDIVAGFEEMYGARYPPRWSLRSPRRFSSGSKRGSPDLSRPCIRFCSWTGMWSRSARTSG